MDERWIDGTEIVPTAAEINAFAAELVPDGVHLLWTGRTEDGYGRTRFRGRPIGAHRLAFALSTGLLPNRRWQVAHRCDRPLCCASACLLLSTRVENADDLWRLREDPGHSLQPRTLALPMSDRVWRDHRGRMRRS